MIYGILYFAVIVIANSLGAVSGMGGGVLIKPIFDLIGRDSVAAISFYSSVAVLTMSVVSTLHQMSSGTKLNWKLIVWIALGAAGGGVLGKNALTWGLLNYPDMSVLAVQIIVTIITILFAFLNTRMGWESWNLSGWSWYLACGIVLGFFASFLGIGGGPINVALLMLMFGMPIKQATVYSICMILFSQAAKVIGVVVAGDLMFFDLGMLWYIIPAAIIGGFVGSLFSHVLNSKYVEYVFQGMLLVLILINLYNGVRLIV